MTDEAIQLQYGPDTVMAVMKKRDGKDLEYRYKDFSVAEKLGKFMEDVKWVVNYLFFIHMKWTEVLVYPQIVCMRSR